MSRYGELIYHFDYLKKEIKEYPEGSKEYMEIIDELSAIYLELCFIRKAGINHIVGPLKDLAGRVILGEPSYKKIVRKKTR